MENNNTDIANIIEWGERSNDIRAIILSSSRSNPHAKDWVDIFSDYDLDIVVEGGVRSWYEDRAWLEAFGKVLVGWVEPQELEYGVEIFDPVTLYQNGTKINCTVMPVEIFK